MPNNTKQMIKDGAIVDNHWDIITDTDSTATINLAGSSLVSTAYWLQHKDALSAKLADNTLGLWIKNDQDISEFADIIHQFPVIAIDFPVFMDGRGFSIARILRDRYNYQGELRATGGIIRDQLCYLKRSGFNAFDLDESIDLQASLASLNDFTESYQTAADQKTPLFRRRGALVH